MIQIMFEKKGNILMKNKIFKKLIAVLCAATISISIVVPSGAVTYSGNFAQSEIQKNKLKNLNKTISNSLELLRIIDQEINNKQSQGDTSKSSVQSLITDIQDNLSYLDTLSIYSRTAIDNAYESMSSLSAQLFSLSETIRDMSFGDINKVVQTINDMSKTILSNAKQWGNVNNNINNINNNKISYDKITRELDQLIATATNNLKNKQQKEFGNDEKFLETMDKLTTDINAGIQTDFEIDGTTQGNCWALTSQTLANFFAHTYDNGTIVKNNNDDVLKATNQNELTTVEKNIDKILNSNVNNTQKINVKIGQDVGTTKKLLSKLDIKTLSFEIPEKFKKSFSSFELQQVCGKIEKYLLLEHFSHNGTPVMFLQKTFWPGKKSNSHATLIIGINTFHNPLEFQLVEHAGTIYKDRGEPLEKDTNVRSVSVGFDQVEKSTQYMNEQAKNGLDSTGLIFSAFFDKFPIETTKNCTWQDFKTTVLNSVRNIC